MASPPYSYSPSAMSPPYPAHAQLPAINTLNMSSKKRSVGDASSPGAPAVKRRKASTMSVASVGSAHPLRQTSFPPDEMMGARSPSVDMDNVSMVSGSQASGAAAAPMKKKRGRKPKAEKLREQTPNAAGGGRAAAAASGASGGGPKSATGAPAGDGGGEDDDAEDLPDAGMATTKRSEEERKEEKRLRAALVACMDIDQYERISAWRAVKLPDAVIRRLVNATVSQSVPASVVTAVRSVTKYFLTELITSAQRVQDEWVKADGEKQADMEWPGKVLARGEPEVKELYGKQAKLAVPEWDPETAELILREEPKGPLRPDHLREAWRRYKAGVENNTAGTLGLWHAQQHSGVERFPPRTGGRIIFK